MASLSLPPPRKALPAQQKQQKPLHDPLYEQEHKKFETPHVSTLKSTSEESFRVPSYEDRCQQPDLFVPRTMREYGDGGAFPEIHTAQYPRNMGNPHKSRAATGSSSSQRGAISSSQALVNVSVDQNGEISYDSIVTGGTNADKIVYSRHEHLKPGLAKPEDVALPTPEEEEEEARKTQAALMALVSKQAEANKPKSSAILLAEASKNIEEKTQFINYTPRPEAPGYNPAAAKRVIQMVPKQVDPLMPPKHKHIKAPRGPAEDPVPVLHAPPTKLTKEDKAQWNIPACISNWKNQRGYVIPLDKRLAADGRGLREHTINPKFATLAESLHEAERQARQEVRLRAQVQKKLALQEKEEREEELRQLAQQARMQRGGAVAAESDSDSDDNASESSDHLAAEQRERLRLERKREREKEMRTEKSMEAKKRKLEEERDVSEKMALGVHTGSGGGLIGEVDSRLYSQTGGMDSGFGAEDEYNTYSKPLFDRGGATSQSIYRPSRGETEYNADEQYDQLKEGATSKFQPDKGFAGAEGGADLQAAPRNAPVQFEKSKN